MQIAIAHRTLKVLSINLNLKSAKTADILLPPE